MHSKTVRTKGWALDRVQNSHRPFDRLQCFFALCDPVTLTFQLQNHITCRIFQSQVFPYTKFKDFGVIRFLVMQQCVDIINSQTHCRRRE